MSNAAKFLVIVVCLLACAGGALIFVGRAANQDRVKTRAVPVTNPRPNRAIPIWA